jgi:signal transduction histidine kinase
MTSDRHKVRQILINLLGNAVKFTEKGSVSLIVRRVPEGVLPGGIECVVGDTGIGIPADRMDELFQPFTQVDEAMTYRHGGTGLGLCISRRLAIALGGDIRVASELGRGSTFTLTLPMDPTGGSVSPLLEHTVVGMQSDAASCQ